MITSTERSQRYRKQHRRLDYVPSPEVLAIIEIYLAKYPNATVCAVLDSMVRIAHKHVESRKSNVAGNA